MGTKAKAVDPDFRKPANIKDFRMGDREYIGEIGTENDCTMGEALSIICAGYKAFKAGATGNSEKEKQLERELEKYKKEHIVTTGIILEKDEKIEELENENERISGQWMTSNDELNSLKNNPPQTTEIPKVIDIDTIKQYQFLEDRNGEKFDVSQTLCFVTGDKFIMDLGPELTHEVRKMRSFLKEKRVYKPFATFETPEGEETNLQYAKRLIKFSTTRFLDWYKSEYIE